MNSLIWRRPSAALVLSLVALFFALAGVGYTASKINGKNIKNKSISGKKLKKNTLTGTQINESKLGQVPSAATADKLGGVAANGFVKGSGQSLHKTLFVAASATGTLFDVTGVGRLTANCSADAHTLNITYRNTSGQTQQVVRTRATEGASPISVSGNTLGINATTGLSSTSPLPSDGHVFTFEATPTSAAQGTGSASFHVTGLTEPNGNTRCIVQGEGESF